MLQCCRSRLVLNGPPPSGYLVLTQEMARGEDIRGSGGLPWQVWVAQTAGVTLAWGVR